jgi:hypothetical protein
MPRHHNLEEYLSRGQPKFEPTAEQRSQVKLMKAMGIPEDRICKTITNPRARKPVAPMTLARAFAAELASGAIEVHALVGNFIICAILGKKPPLGDAIKSEQAARRGSATRRGPRRKPPPPFTGLNTWLARW